MNLVKIKIYGGFKMKKSLALLILSVMLMMLVAACSANNSSEESEQTESTQTESEQTEPAVEEKQKVIGVSLFYRRDEFYKDLENGILDAAEKAGYKVIMQDADTDPKKQAEQIENFIAQKVDAIALAVTDPAGMIPTLKSATDAGIPVFTFDGGTQDNAETTSFIGMDNYDAGQKAGNWVKEYVTNNLNGNANVVIIDFPQSAVVVGNRVKGFEEALKDMPGVKIVAKQDGKASRTDSMTVMENIIQANEKIDVVFGINDDSMFGAVSALEAANRTNVVAISVGWSQELFTKLENKDSFVKASAVQNPYNMGATTVNTIKQYFDTGSAPTEVLDKSELLTHDNVGGFDYKTIISKRK
jgi:ribose transport system substrate-binding protein